MGTTTIDQGYTKGWTADEMRLWAHDVDRANRTPPAELERWRMTNPEQLWPEQRRALVAHDKFMGERQSGIQGTLRPDQTVEIDAGRHRAGYCREQGVDPMPVWVWAHDQRDLDAFDARCQRELEEDRRARSEEAPARRDTRAERSRTDRDDAPESRGDRARA